MPRRPDRARSRTGTLCLPESTTRRARRRGMTRRSWRARPTRAIAATSGMSLAPWPQLSGQLGARVHLSLTSSLLSSLQADAHPLAAGNQDGRVGRGRDRHGGVPWMYGGGGYGCVLCAGDEAGTAVEGEVGEEPLERDQQPVAEADELDDVKAGPGQPGVEAGERNAVDVGNRPVAADRRHVAQVLVAERTGFPAGQDAEGVASGPGALLDGDLGDARQRSPALIVQRRGIADDEDLRVAGQREVRCDQHPAGPVQRGGKAEGADDGCGLDAGRPE